MAGGSQICLHSLPESRPHSLNPFEAAGTDRYLEIVKTGKRLRVVARGILREGLLTRLLQAKEQINWVEDTAGDDGDEKTLERE